MASEFILSSRASDNFEAKTLLLVRYQLNITDIEAIRSEAPQSMSHATVHAQHSAI